MKKGKRSAGWQGEEQTPAGRIEFDLSDEDTETIIDLEEILEVDEDGLLEEEDRLDLDAEILDADADLDADDLEPGLGDDDENLLDEDFLMEFSADREEGIAEPDEEIQSLAGTDSDEDIDFESLLKVEVYEEEPEIGGEPLAGLTESAAVEAAPPEGAAEAGPSSLEPFVAQIEEHLIDAVRQIVEDKLPDIVRSLLEEQIEKLKRELR